MHSLVCSYYYYYYYKKVPRGYLVSGINPGVFHKQLSAYLTSPWVKGQTTTGAIKTDRDGALWPHAIFLLQKNKTAGSYFRNMMLTKAYDHIC